MKGMSVDVLLRRLKRAQFAEVIGEDQWRQFAPFFYQTIAQLGSFTVLVGMRCGCKMPIFYQTAEVKMADRTRKEALLSRWAIPKDWDAQCPNAMLPASAVDKPIFEVQIPWGHTTIRHAVERIEAVAQAEQIVGSASP